MDPDFRSMDFQKEALVGGAVYYDTGLAFANEKI
jgi:hypothetical protein